MRKVPILVAALALLAVQSWAAGGKRCIITFKAGTSDAARAAALAKLKGTEVASILSNDQEKKFVAVVADLPAPKAAKAMGAFDGGATASPATPSDPNVLTVEEDYKINWLSGVSGPVSFQGMPSLEGMTMGSLGLKLQKDAGVRFTERAWHSDIPWGVDRVHAPAAWDTTQGAGVRVAVIDTGIDLHHQALQGKVDGGYNAITDSEDPGSYQDDNGHGTHVSGTIAANSAKLKGVAPKARLYAVKVLDADGSGSLSDVIKGIVWAANNQMQVANMSLGSPMPSDTMQQALRYAKARGVVVVAAAGNSGGAVGYPGAYPEVISVAASDYKDQIASFSSRGPQVKFIAPGVDIYSAQLDGDFVTMSGTSMAAPHVTGLAALAVSQGWRGLDGPDGVMGQLKKAAKPIGSLTAEEEGAGMIDAGRLTR